MASRIATRASLPTAAAPPADRVRRTVSRGLLFGLLAAVALLLAGGYVALSVQRTSTAAQRALAQPSANVETLAALTSQPHQVFLETDGDAYRRVALAPLDAQDGSRALTPLQCQRVYMAAGQGLCLGTGVLGGAVTFGPDFQPRYRFDVSGIPSRARVSPDGRLGAMTVFVRGDSYAESGFSTRTTLLDMVTGTTLGDLEQFTVWRGGERFQSVDFNFWGVTFARDGQRFYATLASGGKTYLIQGDIAAREARVLRENLECPSLSPDGTRLAFKKRVNGPNEPVRWQLYVLDLATMAETPLADTRNVDDQAEWLDDRRVLYFLPDQGPPATIRPDLWVVPADGSGAPERWQTRALSPAVVR